MDLKSGYPYWAVKNGLMYAFPQLDADLNCDVAVVGAGITGALIADELAGYGHDVIVLDQRDVCWGSTSASTALLYASNRANHPRMANELSGRRQYGFPVRRPSRAALKAEYGPRVLFALAYGGNGISYSILGAGLLRAQIEHRPHPLTALFSFARMGYQ